jgi:hypothetical protein
MLGADHRAVTARAAATARATPGWQGAPGACPVLGPVPRPVPGAALLLWLAVLAGGAPAAGAAEWIVGGSVSQRLEADSNRDLDADGEPVYGATTALGLDFTALTPTTQWQIETGASASAFAGPGDTDGLNRVNPNFAAAVDHDGKHVDTGASFAFDMQPVAFAQLDDTGITEGDATQISVRLAADAAYALDRRNRLRVGGSGRILRFSGGSTSLEPTTTFGANLGWGHSISPATEASLSFGARRFTAESEEDPQSVILSLSAGVGHLVNERLSFDASLGVTGTRSTETRAGERETEFSLGAEGGLEVAWAAAADTQLSFALSHGLEPSSLGELRTTTAIGLGLQHAINRWTSAGIDVLLQRQSSGGGFEEETDRDRTYASISPSVAFSLTPDWALQAGYALRLERESETDAVSNRVFLTLTRQFDILP